MGLRRTLAAGIVASVIALAGLSASADDPQAAAEGAAPSATPPAESPAREEPVFGHQLMSKQEMAAYDARLKAAKTPKQREKVIEEHHTRMTEIAKKRGITLRERAQEAP
jgi:hypothetical protein